MISVNTEIRCKDQYGDCLMLHHIIKVFYLTIDDQNIMLDKRQCEKMRDFLEDTIKSFEPKYEFLKVREGLYVIKDRFNGLARAKLYTTDEDLVRRVLVTFNNKVLPKGD